MAELQEWLGSAGNFFGSSKVMLWGIGAAIALAFAGYLFYYIVYKKRNWNLLVEIKIPRSDGALLTAEWAKGFYDTKRGAVFVKRKGKKAIAMEPFEPTTYIQGSRIITVVQLSPEHYVPCALKSFLYYDDKEGNKIAVANVKADFAASRSWKSSFEREAKQAYTIMNLLKDYLPYIGVGIILFLNFAGFAILYSKVT